MKCILILFTLGTIFTCTLGKSEQRRSLIFPPQARYGTFVAIAVPIDLPGKNVFVSYNFEGNFPLVKNITELTEVAFPSLPEVSRRHSRSITRELAYTALETQFRRYGMKGRECMLRNICETAETPIRDSGIIGQLTHYLFTPSASAEESLDDEYYEAEAAGIDGNCDKYLDDCPTSLFDYITQLVEIPHKAYVYFVFSTMKSKMKCFTTLLILSLVYPGTLGKLEQKRALVFPPTSLYGTFVAIAVPVDIPDKNVFVSYNIESNYSVITNITEIDEAIFPNLPIVSSRHSRSITRELAYTVLENRFSENGLNGKSCLLRNICEAAETPLHHNGVVGHLMHIVFTPSASREEGIDDAYYEAEAAGHRGDCDQYLEDCPVSLFDYITRLVELPNKL
ncbi:uncharacterized protein LOC142979064 [Anticarsia gemmatalis]|uniref:uncharacterized protein LOC142979064 n=1 Tax=Anticarsia gemmatalis TaxID=129554 RepID=UPI003F777BFA